MLNPADEFPSLEKKDMPIKSGNAFIPFSLITAFVKFTHSVISIGSDNLIGVQCPTIFYDMYFS